MVKFLLAGSQRCGTSALASFLAQHPQICMATPKEPHFFDNEVLFARRLPNQELLKIYNVFFQKYRPGQLAGEATPIYMYWKPALQRIKQYNPQMKWIFILRNPIERAYSHYIAARKLDFENLKFSEALRKEGERIAAAAPFQDRGYSYMDRGYYSQQIRRILKEYPINNLLFIKTDDLRSEHYHTLGKVWDFLGIDQALQIKPEIVRSEKYDDMPMSDRVYLWDKFRNEIEELESLLGWDCTDWKMR